MPDTLNKQPLTATIGRDKAIRTGTLFILVVLLGLLFGCADHRYTENKELLSKDYLSLSDEDLVLYYQQLEDQIKAVQQDRNSSPISFGFGMGSFGSSYEAGGGVDLTTPSDPVDVITNLHDRRNDVKLEINKRDIDLNQ